MQIESLKVFCDLAETESFTKAGFINNVSQSATSQMITAIEKRFNTHLVERSKKKFRLTREGQMLYEYSKQIVNTYDSLHSNLQQIKDVVSGTLRVATVYSIGLHSLPPFVKRFLKDYPAVNIHVEYRHAEQVYEDVLSNIVDIGLVAYPNNHANLAIVPLKSEPLVLVCPPAHPYSGKSDITLDQLKGANMVGFGTDTPTRKALDKVFRHQKVAVNYKASYDNIETLKRAVEIGTGIAVLPACTVEKEVSAGLLCAIPFQGGTLSRPQGAIYKTTKFMTPAVKHFISVLQETE